MLTESPGTDTSMPSPRRIAELAGLVHAKLPREVRDIIYSFLWDDEVMEKLDYRSHLDPAEGCECNYDAANNAICLCDRPEGIPEFARSASVGYQFAYEAVTWLYEHYEGFAVNSPASARLLFEKDVFHIGLTPSITNRHRLKIEFIFDNVIYDTLEARLSHLQQDFAAFYGEHLLHGSQLRIILKVKSSHHTNFYLYALTKVVEGFTPIIVDIDSYKKVDITVTYTHPIYGQFDVKSMLGSATKTHWTSFIENNIPARMRQKLEDPKLRKALEIHLRTWRRQWHRSSRSFELGEQMVEIRAAKLKRLEFKEALRRAESALESTRL